MKIIYNKMLGKVSFDVGNDCKSMELEDRENTNEVNVMDNSEVDDLTIHQYLSTTKQKFLENHIEFEFDTYSNNKLSFCPKCDFPVVCIKSHVICVNSCFDFKIDDENLFEGEFTLDNLMENYKEVLKEHGGCVPEEVILMQFGDKMEIMCERCLKKELDFEGK